MKQLLSYTIIIGSILTMTVALSYCLCSVADRIEAKEPKPELYPAVMARIDSLQGLTPAMKETALDRLSKLSVDSVEKLLKWAD